MSTPDPFFMQSRKTSDECLSDLSLDRLLAGEIAGAPEARMREHVSACAGCAARWAALGENAAAFPREVWIGGDAARVRRIVLGAAAPAAGDRRRATRRIASFVSLASAAAAIVAVAVLLRPPVDDGTRLKGSDSLSLWVRHADGRVERVAPGAPLATGDAVRFDVSFRESGWVSVIGIDGTRAATVYTPPVQVEAGLHAIPGSVVLDASPGSERFFAVMCAAPIDEKELLASARGAIERAGGDAGRVGPLMPGCRQATFTIAKATP